MKGDELPPLDADLLAVVSVERAIEEPAPDVRARMFAAVSARIGGPAGGGGGGGGGGGVRRPAFALSGWRAPAAIVTAFLLGFATNAVLFPSSRVVAGSEERAAPPVVHVSAPPPASAVTNVPAYPASALPDAPPPPPTATVSAEPDNRGLAGERMLLDVARTALANGDTDRALTSITRHERAYPNGFLVEEREAMAVKALVAAGRSEEARARGARYAKRFPNGLMRPAVERALESIPGPSP